MKTKATFHYGYMTPNGGKRWNSFVLYLPINENRTDNELVEIARECLRRRHPNREIEFVYLAGIESQDMDFVRDSQTEKDAIPVGKYDVFISRDGALIDATAKVEEDGVVRFSHVLTMNKFLGELLTEAQIEAEEFGESSLWAFKSALKAKRIYTALKSLLRHSEAEIEKAFDDDRLAGEWEEVCED